MKNKLISFLFVISVIVLNSYPIYAMGYEDVSLGQTVFKLIFYLLIFALVIVMTVYGTRLISKSFKGIASSKYINLLDAINLPGGSRLVIVRVDKKIYILGINNSTTTAIDIIDEEDFNLTSESFDNYLSKYLNGRDTYKNPIDNLLNKFNKKKDRDENHEEKKY